MALGAPPVLQGQLLRFRAQGFRSLDHRWVLSAALYKEMKSRRNHAATPRGVVSHDDPTVAAFLRLRELSADFELYADQYYHLVRDEDLPVLTAIDIGVDGGTVRMQHSLQCMLLANCDDDEIAAYAITQPEVVRAYHDGFYDVRSRLANQVLIADLVFPPAFSQGGLNALEVDKVVAWMFGAAGYKSFKLGLPDERTDELREVYMTTLRKNVALAATLRRRLGFESNEEVCKHIDTMVVTTMKAKKADATNSALDGVMRGLAAVTKAAGGLQIADETVKPASRVEAVQISMRLH